jgi:hypothetical protein
MSDERLLRDLARLAREQAHEPGPEWERLAAGELSPGERESLRAEAARSAEAAAAWEAFRPLDADFQAQLLARVQQEVAPPPRVLPFRRVPTWARVALPALAAAGLLVALWPSGGPVDLPAYELRLAGASSDARAVVPSPTSTGETLAFAPGNRFELLLTPATTAGADVEARAYLARDGRVEVLPLPPCEVSAEGALRCLGIVGASVGLPPGEADLLIAVGRRGALPNAAELRARLAGADRAREVAWTGWRLRVRGPSGP